MARIENSVCYEAFQTELEKMDDCEILSQLILNRGAMAALTYLKRHGISQANLESMVGNLIGRIAEVLEIEKSIFKCPWSKGDFVRRLTQQMVDELVGKLSKQHLNRIELDIPKSNLEAQLFFRSQGFRPVSIMRDYYVIGFVKDSEDHDVLRTASSQGVQ